MDAIKVYTRRIINELKIANEQFADVEIVQSNGEGVLRVNSLVLAALSSNLANAMKDLQYHDAEDLIKIIIPPEEIDFNLMRTFFENVVFSPDENLDLDQRYLDELFPYLGIELSSRSSIIQSQEMVHPRIPMLVPKEKHQCTVCHKSFNLRKLLVRHIRTFHDDNPNKCSCGRLCRSKSELIIHQRVHTKEKPHTCQFCHKSFSQISHLNEHVNSLHNSQSESENKPTLQRGGAKNICEICGLALSSRGAVQRHMQTHVKNEGYFANSIPTAMSLPVSIVTNEIIVKEDHSVRQALETVSENENPGAENNSSKTYICDFEGCGKALKTLTSLKLHTSTHSTKVQERRPFSCETCSKSFTQKSHLTVHQRTHTGAKPHMCSICGKQFSVRSNMKKHLKMHEKQNKNDENDFLQAFSHQVTFEVKENKHVCEFCGRDFPNHTTLQQHVKTHTHERPFECLECMLSFSTRSEMRIHEKMHNGEEQHICTVCKRTCVSKSALDKHFLIHTQDKPFECIHCHKHFKQKSHVNYHVKMVHGTLPKDRPRNHICFHCGSAFTTASTLKKHVKTHTLEKPHLCKYCGKCFIQKVHLQTHLLRHSGDRPWVCDKCGRGFVTSSVLKEHAKLHSGTKKSFGCTTCGAKYASFADLKIHQRRHTGELPFCCFKCDKGFRSKRLLQEHGRSHFEAKPFACANCGKTFTSASGLRQHFKRHDTCKLASLPGAFGLGTPAVLGEGAKLEDLDKDSSTDPGSALLVDFLPAPATSSVVATVPPGSDANVQENVVLIDNQAFTLSSLPPT